MGSGHLCGCLTPHRLGPRAMDIVMPRPHPVQRQYLGTATCEERGLHSDCLPIRAHAPGRCSVRNATASASRGRAAWWPTTASHACCPHRGTASSGAPDTERPFAPGRPWITRLSVIHDVVHSEDHARSGTWLLYATRRVTYPAAAASTARTRLGRVHACGGWSVAASLLVWGAVPEMACGSGVTSPCRVAQTCVNSAPKNMIRAE